LDVISSFYQAAICIGFDTQIPMYSIFIFKWVFVEIIFNVNQGLIQMVNILTAENRPTGKEGEEKTLRALRYPL
jgi:hypothetical protein